MLKQNEGAFSLHEIDLEHCTMVQHRIDTGKNAPVATRLWPLPHSTRQAVQEEVEKMVELGVVEKCASPWRSPAMLVKKKCGGNRYVIDYRNLNKMVRDDKFPLPRIEEVLESLGGSQYFSSLDCRSGYWQIDVREEDRDKTAFSTDSDTYRFKRMPFGLKKAPAATFQRLMQQVLSEALGEYALVYLDELIIYSPTFKQHLKHLDTVLRMVQNAGLKVSTGKSFFCRQKLRYLGHVVSAEGIEVDDEKVRAMKEMAASRNV